MFPGNRAEAGNLSYPGPGGRKMTVRIPVATPGETLRVDFATGEILSLPGTSPIRSASPSGHVLFGGPTLMGGLEYTTFNQPRSGYGVSGIGNPDGEAFIHELGGRINYATYGGDVLFPVGKFVFGMGYHQGSGSNREAGQHAAGGSPGGIVFIGESNDFGTGLNFGTLGVDIDGWTNVRQRGGYGKIGLPIPCDDGDSSAFPYVKVAYSEVDVRQSVNYSTPAFPTQIRSDVFQDLRMNRFSLGLGGFYNHFLSESFALTVNLEADLHFNSRKLDSNQFIDLFGNTDTVHVQDSDNKTSFGFLAELGATYYVTPNFGFNLFGRYRHDQFIRADNPLSGNDILAGETTRIGNGNIDEFTVGMRLIASFGR